MYLFKFVFCFLYFIVIVFRLGYKVYVFFRSYFFLVVKEGSGLFVSFFLGKELGDYVVRLGWGWILDIFSGNLNLSIRM